MLLHEVQLRLLELVTSDAWSIGDSDFLNLLVESGCELLLDGGEAIATEGVCYDMDAVKAYCETISQSQGTSDLPASSGEHR